MTGFSARRRCPVVLMLERNCIAVIKGPDWILYHQVRCEECEEPVDDLSPPILFDCFFCPARLCEVCAYDHFIAHQLEDFDEEDFDPVA